MQLYGRTVQLYQWLGIDNLEKLMDIHGTCEWECEGLSRIRCATHGVRILNVWGKIQHMTSYHIQRQLQAESRFLKMAIQFTDGQDLSEFLDWLSTNDTRPLTKIPNDDLEWMVEEWRNLDSAWDEDDEDDDDEIEPDDEEESDEDDPETTESVPNE